jgi:hypothetical protein
MRRMKFAGLAILALLALASMPANAFAEAELPSVLNAKGEIATEAKPFESSGSGGTSALQKKEGNTAKIECKKGFNINAFTTTSRRLGKYDILFLECLVKVVFVLALCWGPGDEKAKSSILVLGTWHLVRKPGGGGLYITFLLPTNLKFLCEGGGVTTTIEVKGCAAGAVEAASVDKKITSATTTLNQTGGVNEITKVENNESTGEEECKLLSNENGGAFGQSGEEAKNGKIENFKPEKEIELML